MCVALTPDGSRLAVGMVNGTIAILDIITFREVAVFHAFGTWIWRMAFTPDGNTLFAATLEEMRIWQAASWNDLTKTGNETK